MTPSPDRMPPAEALRTLGAIGAVIAGLIPRRTRPLATFAGVTLLSRAHGARLEALQRTHDACIVGALDRIHALEEDVADLEAERIDELEARLKNVDGRIGRALALAPRVVDLELVTGRLVELNSYAENGPPVLAKAVGRVKDRAGVERAARPADA